MCNICAQTENTGVYLVWIVKKVWGQSKLNCMYDCSQGKDRTVGNDYLKEARGYKKEKSV